MRTRPLRVLQVLAGRRGRGRRAVAAGHDSNHMEEDLNNPTPREEKEFAAALQRTMAALEAVEASERPAALRLAILSRVMADVVERAGLKPRLATCMLTTDAALALLCQPDHASAGAAWLSVHHPHARAGLSRAHASVALPAA